GVYVSQQTAELYHELCRQNKEYSRLQYQLAQQGSAQAALSTEIVQEHKQLANRQREFENQLLAQGNEITGNIVTEVGAVLHQFKSHMGVEENRVQQFLRGVSENVQHLGNEHE